MISIRSFEAITETYSTKWYHQSGLLKATDRSNESVDKIFDNYKKLGADVGAELISTTEVKTRFGNIYDDTNLANVDNLLWNPSCGWAEAEYALKDTIQQAIDNGVHYVTTTVSKLIFEDDACTGISTTDGRKFTASKVILSTGAYTAKILADCAPTRPDLQAGDRITAAGVCEAYVNLDAKQVERFKHVPAFVLDANETQGETMPPTSAGQLKFIRDISFAHTVRHDSAGQDISIPFTSTERSQWTKPEDMPAGIREEIKTVMKGLYGKELEGLEPSTYRFCWDGISQDANWYISPHPRCKNLYIATAGSFHGWKFLPIIGEYVVQMLKGELSDEMKDRWDWDRDTQHAPKAGDLPKRELKDMK